MPETRQMNKFNSRVQDKLKELQNLEYISEDNYQNIEEFTEYFRADTNVSNQRIYKYLCTFKVLFKDYIDFDLKQADKKQWRKAAGKINNCSKSPHTSREYIVTAKKYYNTVFETQTVRPDRIKKILNSNFMSTNSPSGRKREYEALTPEQVTTERDNRWMKIEDPKNLVPSKFLEEKRREFQDYQNETLHRVGEIENL